MRTPVARLTLTITLSALALTGCSKSSECRCGSKDAAVVAPATPAQQAALLDKVKSLAGEWEMVDDKGQARTAAVFTVTSNGSVVREIMFPGSDHEMTNMYSMDGSSLVVTHYCAMGNQPKMRCTAASGNTIPCTFDSVSNLRASDEMYMGGMTLVFVDDNTLRQDWKSFKQGAVVPEHCPSFELRRKK